MKDWTVMVYLAGDNNLSEECVWNLKEMYRAEAGLDKGRIAVVVQIDPIARDIRRYEITLDLGIRRRELKRKAALEPSSASLSPVTNEVEDGKLFRLGRPVQGTRDGMASATTLADFIRKSKNDHPASRYMLILSGHGGGSIGDSFLMDGFPPSSLSMRQLRSAIRKGGRIDVLGMDSCGMAMAEVAYQLPNNVKYLVAAEGFELNTGWPYHKLLGALNSDPDIEERDIAARIVFDHTRYYSDYILAGVSTDLAAYNLGRKEELAEAVANLAAEIGRGFPEVSSFEQRGYYVEDMDAANRSIADDVILAHWRAQSYRFEEHTDLYDFCDLLEKGCADTNDATGDKAGNRAAGDKARIRKACNRVKSVIAGSKVDDILVDGEAVKVSADGFVIKSCHSGAVFQHSHGVSIYFPWAEFFDKYNKLRFAKATGWGDLIKALVQRTRRQARPGTGKPHPAPRADDSATIVKDNPLMGTKDNILMGTKDNPLMGTKGQFLIPKVKNPPDIFYDDNC